MPNLYSWLIKLSINIFASDLGTSPILAISKVLQVLWRLHDFGMTFVVIVGQMKDIDDILIWEISNHIV